MELAAYIYDAWAYEIANQDANQDATELNLLACDEFGADKYQKNELDWDFTAMKRQAYLLSAIAFTSLSGWGCNLAPVMAAHVLEPSVNVAPWCDNLYICETSYMLDVQTLLARRGFAVGEIDGVYGRYTKQAVIDFQKTQTNLVADGIPGAKTLALLRNSSASQPITPQQPKPTIQPATNPTTNPTTSSDRPSQTIVIVRSDSSQVINLSQPELSEIGNLQMLLKQRGFYQGEIDGAMGQTTTNAIFMAQQAYGLSQDGFAGPLTIRSLLAGGSNVALSQPAIDRPPKPEDVLQFQMFLRDRGFYNGDLNGVYNMTTKASILKAQIAYGLKASGELNNELFAALKGQNMIPSNLVAEAPKASLSNQSGSLINAPITVNTTNNAPINVSPQLNKDTTNSSQILRSVQNEPPPAEINPK